MPATFIFSLIFALFFWIAVGTGFSLRNEKGATGPAMGFALLFGLLSFVFFLTASYDKVEEYEVGIPISFGNAGEPLGPGITWHAPWVSVKYMDTRVHELSFSGDDTIESQAKGGGSLDLDMRIQWRIPVAGATDVYTNIGPAATDEDLENIVKVVIKPAARECPRNVTTSFTPEGAFTTDREQIRDETLECLREEVAQHGIEIPDLFLGEVDPGAKVKDEIDTKVAVQQQINRAAEELVLAEVELQKGEVAARQEAVAAFGISQAEQIISCGGIPDFDEAGNIVNVTPDENCDDQFPQEYLTWLFIQSLDQVGSLTVVAPGLDASLLLPAAEAQAAPQ